MRAVADAAASRGARAPRACALIPHGVPDLPFCVDKAALKAAFGFAPSDFLILAGGHLSPGKGLEYVLAAMPSVAAVWPDTKVRIWKTTT